MRRFAVVLAAVAAAVSACGGGTPKKDIPRDTSAAEQTTGGAVRDSAAGMAAMPGMDHGQMPGMAPAQRGRAAAAPMARMDHGQMPGMAPAQRGRAAAAPMARMDHGQMPGMTPAQRGRAAAAPMAGMDHGAMPGTRERAPATAPMAGMEMPADAGEQKLDRLIAALVRDSVVRRRIQQDSVLRKHWDDAAALAIVRATPHP